MINPDSKNSEFTSPPDEFPVLREDGRPVLEEGLGPTETAEEFPAPGPELIAPGAFPWQSGAEKRRRGLHRMGYFAAGLVLLLLCLGPWKGRAAAGERPAGPALPPPTNSVQPQQTLPPTVRPQPEPTPEPMPLPTPQVTPRCEIIAISFASEMQGKILFENMDAVEKVTLQIWDTLTESMDLELDITDEAMNYGAYEIEPFTTDFIYENHKAAYVEADSFPMEVEYRVIMDCGDGFSVTSTQRSLEEDGWYVYYTPEGEPWGDAGCFTFATVGAQTLPDLSFGEPWNVKEEGMIDIVVIIGDQQLDPETFTVMSGGGTVYRNGTEEEVVFYKVIVPRPPEYPEGEGMNARFDVTQYLHNYGISWTTEHRVGF